MRHMTKSEQVGERGMWTEQSMLQMLHQQNLRRVQSEINGCGEMRCTKSTRFDLFSIVVYIRHLTNCGRQSMHSIEEHNRELQKHADANAKLSHKLQQFLNHVKLQKDFTYNTTPFRHSFDYNIHEVCSLKDVSVFNNYLKQSVKHTSSNKVIAEGSPRSNIIEISRILLYPRNGWQME